MRVKQNKWVILALVATLLVLGLVAAWQMDFFSGSPAAPVNNSRGKAKEKQEPGKVKDAVSEKASAKAQAQRPASPVRQVYNSASTLGDLSRYRGQKILLEQQVRIAELEQRLKEISQPKSQIILPDLTPPKSPKKEDTPLPALTAPKRGPVVVSVQGIGKELSATLRNSEGKLVTIKNGAAYAGGMLQVTLKSVAVRRAGKVSPIPFE